MTAWDWVGVAAGIAAVWGLVAYLAGRLIVRHARWHHKPGGCG